ncbi:MAG: hypothetical protein HY010_13955 [Acidobacteria bacterium]|nr:hypothetical protein [Acidobacteriota bacterium]
MRTFPCFYVIVLLLASLVACSKPETPAPEPSAASQETGLERIPEPDSTKFPRMQDLAQWKNPQLVVREDGIGLVDVENHEIHILKMEQVEAELVSLPETAWPYGRAVLLSQAAPSDNSDQAKAKLRENRGLLVGTLKSLQVQIREAPGTEILPPKQ